MKKKLLSLVLIFTFLLSITAPAMAQGESAKISQEQALKIAQDTLGISDNLKNIQISYREEEYSGSRRIWEFSWDNSFFGEWHNYRVEVDADTGDIISYSEHQNWDRYQKAVKARTEQDCKAIAESFLKKVIPQKFSQLAEKDNPYKDYQLWDSYGPRQYNFAYERKVNGIPFAENNINISINADNGKVMNFYSNWDASASFPAATPKIEAGDAEKMFNEKFGLRLNYIQPYSYSPLNNSNNKKEHVKLYYTLGDYYFGMPMVDANSGRMIDQYGKDISVQKQVYLPVKEEPTVTPVNKKTLSLDEAKEKVKQYISIPEDFTLRSSRYNEGWGTGSQKVWDFDYGLSNYGGGGSLNVGIDAVTGDIIRYNKWEEGWERNNERKIVYNYEKCKQIATSFIKKVASEKEDYVALIEPVTKQLWYNNGKVMDPPAFSFMFQRVVNGVPFPSNSISVEIDNFTGEVRNFWLNWDSGAKFAEKGAIITEQQAIDKFFEVQKPSLVYTYKLNEKGSPSREIVLVYRFFNEIPKMVDAVTGEIIDSYQFGNPVVLEDIAGHWAEREIRALGAWGVVAGTNKKFNPDKYITKAEFVNMLVVAKGLELVKETSQTFKDVPNTAWYFGAVEAAAKAGLIHGSGGKFNPDKPISRQEVVTMLINSLNGSAQLEVSPEVLARFKDNAEVAPWAQKYVSQAVQMEVLTGKNEYLKPEANATKAEAAVLLLKLIRASDRFGGFGSRIVYG